LYCAVSLIRNVALFVSTFELKTSTLQVRQKLMYYHNTIRFRVKLKIMHAFSIHEHPGTYLSKANILLSNVAFIRPTARSELQKVMFLAPSVCGFFCSCIKYLGNR